jgi:hypothetical protein
MNNDGPAYLLSLAAHKPLTADERAANREHQAMRTRVRLWGVAFPVLIAGFVLGTFFVQYNLPEYHIVVRGLAAIVYGGSLGVMLLGLAGALLNPREADHTTLSPYWAKALENAAAPFPEIDAVREKWLREAGELTGVEYHHLNRAIRDAHMMRSL